MKIQIFSDIHGDLNALEKCLANSADVYIVAGDLATFGHGLERCGPLLQKYGERVWVIPGNHENAEDIEKFCARFGLVNFHHKARQLGPMHWAGLGYSNITPFNTPGEYTEEQIAETLEKFRDLTPLYLVAHVPPHGSKLDEFAPGKHAGSTALRGWIEREQPEMLFCGHIHECAGKSDQIGRTRCFNVGKAGYLLELA